MSELSKEEKERQRHIALEEMRKKLAEEWGDKSVKLPKLLYFWLNLYQFCLPAILPIVLTWTFFHVTGIYELSYIYKILLFPIVICLDYLLYIVMMTKLCTILVNRWERISPRVEGVFRRSFEESNVEDDRIKYYHARGFLYKWPVFTAKKSIFPWTVNYVLRNVGKNKIHRDAQYLDCFVALEFTDIGDQMFIMYATTLSSHVVDSLYGNLTIKTIKGEQYSSLQPHGIVSPGVTIKEKNMIFGFLTVPKDKVVTDLVNFPHGIKYKYDGMESVVPEDMLNEWNERKKKLEKYMPVFEGN